MPRKTSLRLLDERPAPEIGDPDDRSVVEVFPGPPPPVADDGLAADILEILRKSHDRIEGEVRQVSAVAAAAVERVDGAVGRIEAAEGVVQAIAAKTAEIEKSAAASGQAVLSQVSQLLSTDRAQSRQMAAAGIVAGLGSLGEKLARSLVFAIDRLPALLALAAAVWLFNGILADPKPLQLVTLGLFGAVVVAPAIWLGKFGRG
jgi:hypothetical protein